MDSWFTNVQLGFDMATSLTIVGAAVTWVIREKKQTEAEKVRGINQQVRSTSLKKVQDVLFEMEDKFSVLISETQTYENMIDNRVRKVDEQLDYSRLNLAIKRDGGFLVKAIDRLQSIREELGQFYELIQVRRYSLIPLLDAIEEGDKYICVFQQNIDEVGDAYNKVTSGNVSLLKELEAVISLLNNEFGDELVDVSDDVKKELFQKISTDQKFMQPIQSIIYDEDYFYWVERFVPAGKEDDYLEKVVRSSKIEDTDLCSEVMVNFILALIGKNHELISQVLRTASTSVMKARMECKDILISLSAISHKLVMDNNSESLNNVITKYESEEYFGRNVTIR
jgi:seryl-tRNA synthetase